MANRYAERKEVVNPLRERQYIDEVMQSDYLQDCSDYVNNDLLPRIEKQRAEVARLRMLLDEKETDLNRLESELSNYIELDNNHYSKVYDYHRNFESKLTDEQIKVLLPVINEYVFFDKQTVESMRMWLECKNEFPVRVKDIAELCNLLNLLRDNGYICGNAQTVAEDNKTFEGGRGAIITQKSFTASFTKACRVKDIETNKSEAFNEEIYDAIKTIKTIKE